MLWASAKARRDARLLRLRRAAAWLRMTPRLFCALRYTCLVNALRTALTDEPEQACSGRGTASTTPARSRLPIVRRSEQCDHGRPSS